MVKSQIPNVNIDYPEHRDIDQEDIGYKSDMNQLNLFGHDVFVTIGNIKYTYQRQGLVYFPIYLVINDRVTEQIGLYEIPIDKTFQLVNNGEIDTELFDEELLYSFTRELILSKTKKTIETPTIPVPISPNLGEISPKKIIDQDIHQVLGYALFSSQVVICIPFPNCEMSLMYPDVLKQTIYHFLNAVS